MANTPEASGILIAVGRDRLGLANAVAAFVHTCDCTVDDADMQTFCAYFSIILKFCGTNYATQKVRNDAKIWGDNHGLDIKVYDDLPEYTPPPDALLYELRVDAIERMGIIDELTRILHKHNVNIRELTSGIEEMPLSGDLRYVLRAILQVPAQSLASIREALDTLELDYTMPRHLP